jgi:argininosuccinate synthase
VALDYAELVYYGKWFTTLREALQVFVGETQKTVTGTVNLRLYKGNVIVTGRQSRESLYREDFATFAQDEVYNQRDAEGFINLFGLPLKVRALREMTETGRTRYAVPEPVEIQRD